jgi:hypothetical protein
MKNVNKIIEETLQKKMKSMQNESKLRGIIKELILEVIEEEKVDEGIPGSVGAMFGAFNTEAIAKAEKKLRDGKIESTQGNKPDPNILKTKLEEFLKLKKIYEEGKANPKVKDEKNDKVFKEVVKHINLNNNILYKVEDNTFKSSVKYGREGGTAAGAGGGA